MKNNLGQDYHDLIEMLAEDKNYEALLREILAVVHRDSGQYTILAGIPCSVIDGIINVQDLLYKNREMSDALARRKKNDSSQGS
jgi:hypothetical protein